jgi:hypothetical protein
MGYYMITGVDRTKTGSYDAEYDNYSFNLGFTNFAYLGIPSGSSNPTSSAWTWPVASRADSTLRDSQMYTPYPTGTERGKLYWVDIATFVDTPGILDKEFYVELQTPPDNQYYIITPSLNASGLSTGGHIAQYSFADEDDLFENGWRSQRGTTDASNALATEANWDSLVNDAIWTGSPFNFNPSGTPGDKAKIVANILAYTNTSYDLQDALGLTGPNIIKGAIVLAGGGTPFANGTYKGLVPLFG